MRIKVKINLEKPIKRGTKIRFGDSNPIWLPVTYERLPSFCYWCGKLGHTHRDCLQVHEKEDKGEILEEADFPYGDWMRASPLKAAMVMNTSKEREKKEHSRRNLFQNGEQGNEQHEMGEEDNKRVDLETDNQVNALLNSLEKVEVSPKVTQVSKDPGKQENKSVSINQNPNPLYPDKANHSITKPTSQITYPKYTHTRSQCEKTPLIPDQNPSSQTLLPKDDHNMDKQSPSPPVKLIPLANLVKMVQGNLPKGEVNHRVQATIQHLMTPKIEEEEVQAIVGVPKAIGTWKRSNPKGQKKSVETPRNNSKRKENEMSICEQEDEERKSESGNHSAINEKTAKAVKQPRRTL